MPRKKIDAVAYCRTSSASNVGAEKDSLPRQNEAIRGYAKQTGFVIVDQFYDPAVSGEDVIETRPGFSALMDRIEGNGVSTVLVEDASRLARSVLAQELAVMALKARGVRVLDASGNDLTETDDPTKVLMRQIAAAFAQYEKSRLVHKLKAARDRKRAETGRCEGRKPVPTEVISEARRLARRSPKTGIRRSLRKIAAGLADKGYHGPSGKPYGAESIKRMIT